MGGEANKKFKLKGLFLESKRKLHFLSFVAVSLKFMHPQKWWLLKPGFTEFAFSTGTFRMYRIGERSGKWNGQGSEG
jgi:hypothetical protein